MLCFEFQQSHEMDDQNETEVYTRYLTLDVYIK